MILGVALDPALRTAFFTPRDWARLEALADIRLLPQPDDCVAPANRAVLSVAEGLLTGWGCPPLTPALLDWCPALKLLVHTGGSVRAFVGPAVYARGILVASQTERNAEPVAEFCLAQILLAAKGVGRATREYAGRRDAIAYDEPWVSGVGVRGATVGLIGYGRVARRLIELLRGFPLRILLASPYVEPAQARALGVELANERAVMATADVISVHLGDTENNHSAISAELLSLVKPGATFINTARGIVVDEAALVRELATGRFDAVLDVTWPGVPAPGSPLWTLPNVTLTPHWAGSLGRELTRLGEGAVDDIAAYIAGEPVPGLIDPATAAYIA